LDFVQYTAKAYNLLLMLVDLILGAFFGPFRVIAFVIIAALLVGLGLLLWGRHRARRAP
jgi:hypothetical protein